MLARPFGSRAVFNLPKENTSSALRSAIPYHIIIFPLENLGSISLTRRRIIDLNKNNEHGENKVYQKRGVRTVRGKKVRTTKGLLSDTAVVRTVSSVFRVRRSSVTPRTNIVFTRPPTVIVSTISVSNSVRSLVPTCQLRLRHVRHDLLKSSTFSMIVFPHGSLRHAVAVVGLPSCSSTCDHYALCLYNHCIRCALVGQRFEKFEINTGWTKIFSVIVRKR